MRIFSGKNKIESQQHYTVLPDNEPTDPEAWKARLVEQLPPLHDRSPFDHLVSDYLTEDKKPDLSLLVCACMRNGNVPVLTYILANEDIKKLCIEGPIDEQGWKTLAKAMPDSLSVEELKLSKLSLNASKCALLFENVLSRMSEQLETLVLRDVKVKRNYLIDKLKCPDLPRLLTVKVSGHGDPKVGVYPFLREILKACQLERMSIQVSGAMSVGQHSKIAILLLNQTRLNSVQLRIEHRATPGEFECFMPLLCGKTHRPLVKLDLSGCCIQVHNFNKLVKALSLNQPELESLSLGGCSLAEDPECRENVNVIDLLPLARLKKLQHLDLSSNHLPKGKTVALLKALKEAGTPLVTLNVSGNQIGSPAISAIADLLRWSETLLRISCKAPVFQADLGDPLAMMDLSEAAEHNGSLLEFEFRWPRDLHQYRDSVTASLYRNRYAPQLAFMGAAVETAAAFAMPLLAGDLQYPQDMIQHIIRQGLTQHDALTLSSLNHQTREAHGEFLRKAGS